MGNLMTKNRTKSPPVVVFANQKGGVGKTTLTVHAAWMAAEAGLKTLLIDMDGQGNASRTILGKEALGFVAKVREEARKGGSEKQGIEQILISSDLVLYDLESINLRALTGPPGLDMIPAFVNDQVLADCMRREIEVIPRPRNNLNHFLSKYGNDYDLILIDSPPQLGNLQSASIAMATDVVIPINVSGFALDGVRGMLPTLATIRDAYNPELRISGILTNMYNRRSLSAQETQQELITQYPDAVIPYEIGVRSSLDAAVYKGMPIWYQRRTGSALTASKEVTEALAETLARTSLNENVIERWKVGTKKYRFNYATTSNRVIQAIQQRLSPEEIS
ncbi:hypothetical protein CEK60_00380 [Halomonas sp. N3-2A]|nr:hypothetical protein CEK60_00380 [Halomonas sp. N3-2A]